MPGPSNSDMYSLWPMSYHPPPVTPLLRTPITPHFSSVPYEPMTPNNPIGSTPEGKLILRKTPGAGRPGNHRHTASPMPRIPGFNSPSSSLFPGSRGYTPGGSGGYTPRRGGYTPGGVEDEGGRSSAGGSSASRPGRRPIVSPLATLKKTPSEDAVEVNGSNKFSFSPYEPCYCQED